MRARPRAGKPDQDEACFDDEADMVATQSGSLWFAFVKLKIIARSSSAWRGLASRTLICENGCDACVTVKNSP